MNQIPTPRVLFAALACAAPLLTSCQTSGVTPAATEGLVRVGPTGSAPVIQDDADAGGPMQRPDGDPLRAQASVGLGSFEDSFGVILRGDAAYRLDGPWAAGAEAWLGLTSDNTQFRLSPYAEYGYRIDDRTNLRGQAGLDIYVFDSDEGNVDVDYTAFGLRGGAVVEHQLDERWTGVGAVHLGFLSGDADATVALPGGGSVRGSSSESTFTFDLEVGARYALEGGRSIGASFLVQSFDFGDFVGIFGTYTF